MEVRFNVAGEERKGLVKAIGEITGAEPIYLGAPSFAYAVNNITVSKDGTLSWDGKTDEHMIHELVGKLRELGYVPEESDINDDMLTICVPLDGFTESALSNLERLIASKASLIKKATGAESLKVERTDTTLRFPWFRLNLSPEQIDAYSRFVCALCEMAKKQHRVTAKEKHVENEKYAFRVFLIRLGFVGKEHKAVRNLLLENLSGNSAFKNGVKAKSTEDSVDE